MKKIFPFHAQIKKLLHFDDRDYSRLIFWLPIIIIAGIAYQSKQAAIAHITTIGLFSIFLLLVFHSKKEGLKLGILFLIAFFSAFLFASYRHTNHQINLIETSFESSFEARIYQIIEKPHGASILIDQIDILPPSNHPNPDHLQISLRQKNLPSPGDRIRFSAKILPPSQPALIDGFDLSAHAQSKNIQAYGFSIAPASVIGKDSSSGFAIKLEKLRHNLSMKVGRVNPKSPETAMAKALLIGKKRAIPDPVTAALRQAGLAHILAISGLHIGLVAFGSYLILSRLLLILERPLPYFQPHKAAACIALIIAFCYMILAGANITTQRAFIMTSLVLLAILIERPPISMHLTMIAALIILILHPQSFLTASFQMSFIAVIALVAFYESKTARYIIQYCRRFSETNNQYISALLRFFLGLTLTSAVASLATMPFILYHFGTSTTYGILANIIGLPIVTFWILPLGILSLLLIPFGLETPTLIAMGWGSSIVIDLAEWIAQLPHAQWRLPKANPSGFILLVFGMLWLFLWRSRLRYLGIAAIISGALWSWVFNPTADIVISENGTLIAIRGENQHWLFYGEKSNYERKQFQDTLGIHASHIHNHADDTPGINCASSICSLKRDQHKALIILSTNSFDRAKACHNPSVTLLILPFTSSGNCPAPGYILDKDLIEKNGAHNFYLERGQWFVRKKTEENHQYFRIRPQSRP